MYAPLSGWSFARILLKRIKPFSKKKNRFVPTNCILLKLHTRARVYRKNWRGEKRFRWDAKYTHAHTITRHDGERGFGGTPCLIITGRVMFLFVSFAYKSLRGTRSCCAQHDCSNGVYGEYSLKRVARACETTASAVPKTKDRDYKTFRTRCDVIYRGPNTIPRANRR